MFLNLFHIQLIKHELLLLKEQYKGHTVHTDKKMENKTIVVIYMSVDCSYL